MSFVANEIISFVKNYINSCMDTLSYDRTKFGKVVSSDGVNAIVDCNEQELECRIKDGISIATGDVVIVKIPNNNSAWKYIDGKLKR